MLRSRNRFVAAPSQGYLLHSTTGKQMSNDTVWFIAWLGLIYTGIQFTFVRSQLLQNCNFQVPMQQHKAVLGLQTVFICQWQRALWDDLICTPPSLSFPPPPHEALQRYITTEEYKHPHLHNSGLSLLFFPGSIKALPSSVQLRSCFSKWYSLGENCWFVVIFNLIFGFSVVLPDLLLKILCFYHQARRISDSSDFYCNCLSVGEAAPAKVLSYFYFLWVQS